MEVELHCYKTFVMMYLFSQQLGLLGIQFDCSQNHGCRKTTLIGQIKTYDKRTKRRINSKKKKKQ